MTIEHANSPIGDGETGLFTEAFLRTVLPIRVATARRSLKQLGLVVARVGVSKDQTPLQPAALGELVRRSVRDSDIAAILDDGRVAMLLEFTPVDGCMVVAERFVKSVSDAQPELNACIGLASYPVHALDDVELLAGSAAALQQAIDAGPGSVVVAPPLD